MTFDPTNLQSAASAIAHSLSTSGSNSTAAAASSAAPTSSSGATISSNDFLSLLVTEMKNQDPTQPTDPNAYIQQLVGVNSLQQLIAINQDLTGASSSAQSSGASAPVAAL